MVARLVVCEVVRMLLGVYDLKTGQGDMVLYFVRYWKRSSNSSSSKRQKIPS